MTLTRPTIAAAAMLAAAWWFWRASAAADEVQQLDTLDQLQGTFDDYTGTILEAIHPTDDMTAETNTAAFLATIRAAEGTAGPNGYRTLFGGSLFNGWADHPRQAKQFTDRAGRKLWTSAAGAYQFMAISRLPNGSTTTVNTWDRISARLNLPDFSPDSQDRAAIELIREAGALPDVRAGRFDAAISKVRKIWASLPGAGYQQGERSRDWLASVYTTQGGNIV